MVDLLNRCFKNQVATPEWQEKLKQMIPSFGVKLNENPQQLEDIRLFTSQVLKIEN